MPIGFYYSPGVSMLRRFSLALALILLLSQAQAFEFPSRPRGKTLSATGTVQVAFTPGDDATELIVRAIEGARYQVLVQAYSFTSRDIAFALVSAKHRGVDVQLIADDEQVRKNDRNRVADIAAGGVPVYIDAEHAIAHNKVMVIDAGQPGATVVTGSFNFTHAAQYDNAENLLLLRGNAPLVDAYLANWKRHREHSRPYRR